MDLPLELDPKEVNRRINAGEALALIDCREEYEHALARIEPCELIPMKMVPAQLNRLESEADDKLLVVYCHHGMRSLSVVNWLRQQGVANCVSMSGGIDQWSQQIDPTIARY